MGYTGIKKFEIFAICDAKKFTKCKTPKYSSTPLSYRQMNFHLFKICGYFKIVLFHLDSRIGHFANTELSIALWKHKLSVEHLPASQMIKVTGCYINAQIFHYIEVTIVWSKPTELKGSFLLIVVVPFIKTEVLDKVSNKTHLPRCCVQVRNHLYAQRSMAP